jgi:hypothetical protein
MVEGMASGPQTPWFARPILAALRVVFWFIELPDTLGSAARWWAVRRQARAQASKVMAARSRSGTLEPAELKALGLPSAPLPVGWQYALGTVVASVAQPIAGEDHFGSASWNRYQGIVGFFDQRQGLRLVRMPLHSATEQHVFDRGDEQHFRVGRHFVVAFDPRGRGYRIFAKVRPLLRGQT